MTKHADPFLGKCIHGIPGARHQGGHIVNPNCVRCQVRTQLRTLTQESQKLPGVIADR